MANHKSALKRARQNEKRNLINKAQKSNLRSSIKKLSLAINANDKDGAINLLKSTVSTIDKAARKGLIHKKNAARNKSRLIKKINTLA